MTEYSWFIEPLDDFTNECIAREASERREHVLPGRDRVCADNEPHNLWECSHTFIRELRRSQQPLRFAVWVREGGGKIRRWKFETRKKKTYTLKRGSELK